MKTLIAICTLCSPLFAGTVASGKLVLPKELAEKAKGIRTVFISVHDPKAAAPMPCAAQKLTLTKDAEGDFFTFALKDESLMLMACPSVPETMNLKAKLDRDGSAGRDGNGDIVGTIQNVKKGSANLTIVLDKSL